MASLGDKAVKRKRRIAIVNRGNIAYTYIGNIKIQRNHLNEKSLVVMK